MSELAARLRQLRPQFLAQVAQAAGAITTSKDDATRFYDALIAASETEGTPASLFEVFKQWGDLTTLHLLRQWVWETVRLELPPAEALQMVMALEDHFAACVLCLTERESERQAQATEAQLRQMRARLERLDQSKSKFVSVAAHELRTPLTLIEGYARLMMNEVEAEQFHRLEMFLQGLEGGVKRLEEIVEAIVDISLIDNDMLALSYQPLWLGTLIQQLQVELAEVLAERRLTLNTVNVVDMGFTYADSERARQMLLNLLENAIKFTPDEGAITVSVQALPGFFEIAVADTGIGIAAENLEHIFDKFTAVGNVALHTSSKTKFKGGGPGLGLSIARGIAHAHGGTIWVESPGYDEQALPGSVFHVMLPELREPPNVASRLERAEETRALPRHLSPV